MSAITQDSPSNSSTDNPETPPQASFGPSPTSSELRQNRPLVIGSDAPERPYPIYLHGEVERGFGRGGKDLGCPTANLPARVLGKSSTSHGLNRTGIYFGWARVLPQDPDDPELSEDGETDQEEGQAPPNVMEETAVVDDEEEEEDNEIVLSASPIYSETHSGSQGLPSAVAGAQFLSSHRIIKPRQGSKSSIQSSKSTATVVEALDSAPLLGTTPISNASVRPSKDPFGLPSPSLDESKEAATQSAGALNSATNPNASNPSDALSKAGSAKAIAGEKHPRDLSATSSSASLRSDEAKSGADRKADRSRRKKKVRVNLAKEDSKIFPMVMSVGWNPFYGNTKKTAVSVVSQVVTRRQT